jgi:hypothetical protein
MLKTRLERISAAAKENPIKAIDTADGFFRAFHNVTEFEQHLTTLTVTNDLKRFNPLHLCSWLARHQVRRAINGAR